MTRNVAAALERYKVHAAIEKYKAPIKEYIRKRIGAAPGADVDEVVQQCLIRLWQLGDISEHPNQDALVFKVARGKALNYLRDRQRRDALVATNCTAIQEDMICWDGRTDCLDKVQHLVAALPPSLKAVMQHRLDGRSNKQIAACMGLTEECVESRCVRAMKKLKARAHTVK